MPSSAVREFADPEGYQRTIRAADMKVFVTAAGAFQASLTRIDLHRLWMQRGWTSLPYIAHSALSRARSPIFFQTKTHQAVMHHTGIELRSGEIMFTSSGAEHYHRLGADSHWGAMSLAPEDLAAAGRALAGCDVTAPLVTTLIRPPPPLMARLLRLHEAAGHLAVTVPEVLAHPEVARAIEQGLVRAMVACLTEGIAVSERALRDIRVPVMRRFERLLEENADRALYVTEICAAIGISERMLRLRCIEETGMSPHRYLWLRRMNLVRRALARAVPRTTTVTAIAADYGFGELGRFSVGYHKLFGETPSETLGRPADDPPGVWVRKDRLGRLAVLA